MLPVMRKERLLAGAAIGTKTETLDRCEALIEAELMFWFLIALMANPKVF